MTDRPGTRRSRRSAERGGRSPRVRHTQDSRGGIRLPVASALAAIGGVSLIALVVAFGGAPKAESTDAGRVGPAALPDGIVSAGMSLGQPDAPVRVDLYEDFQCPACRQWGD